MGSNHDYRLKDKDKWTKKEFEKIFFHSNLIWPSNTFGGRGSPTHLTRVYVEVRTPYDGIVLEGIINKLGRKGLAQFHESTYVNHLSLDESKLFGKNFTDIVPDRVTLDLDTDKMSKLKEIINDLHNAKNTIQELTGIKGVGTKSKLFQLRHTALSFAGGFYNTRKGVLNGGQYIGDKLSDTYDRKNVVPLVEKYIEFVDPEYLTQDLDRVNRLFSVLIGDSIGMRIHDAIADYRNKKNQQKNNESADKNDS